MTQHKGETVVIEAGIPIPPRTHAVSKGRPPVYPFATIEVGKSFLVRCDPDQTSSKATVSYWNRKFPDRRFTRRRVKEGYRIWREQ